jgi:AcrR family transcriptional regulator
MSSDREPKGAATRARLVDTAFDLFTSQGYHGTSLRQIGEAAGLSTASGIYNHFKSKEAVFEAVLERYHPYHEILPLLEQAHGSSAEDLVRDAARQVYGVVKGNKKLLHLMFTELVEFEGKHTGKLFQRFYPNIQHFVAKMRRAKGRLRPIGDANLIFALISVILGNWILQTALLKKVPGAVLRGQMQKSVEIYLHGILEG